MASRGGSSSLPPTSPSPSSLAAGSGPYGGNPKPLQPVPTEEALQDPDVLINDMLDQMVRRRCPFLVFLSKSNDTMLGYHG